MPQEPYRWLGGIGYILGLVPYISLVSLILIAVARILIGRDTRERIFTILGILMIMTCSLAIAFAAWLIFPLMRPLAAPWGMGGAHGIPAQLLSIIVVVAALLLIGLAIASFILDIIAHFRAGRIFNSRWFRAAGWTRIILAVTLIAVIAFMALTIISAVPRPLPAIPPTLRGALRRIRSAPSPLLAPGNSPSDRPPSNDLLHGRVLHHTGGRTCRRPHEPPHGRPPPPPASSS